MVAANQLICKLNLSIEAIETGYKSPSQIARVKTERWTLGNFYCASCGSGLSSYPTNTPLYDFHSPECRERFQLKASKSRFGMSVLDSEYHTALNGIMRDEYPSLILLRYERARALPLSVSTSFPSSTIKPHFPLTASTNLIFPFEFPPPIQDSRARYKASILSDERFGR